MDHAHILVIEDNPEICAFTDYILKQYGEAYIVSFAYDGVQGIEQVQVLRPDLILLDIRMPRLNGYQVMQKIRSCGDTTPIIALTAMTSEENEVSGFEYGCDDYIHKPIKPTILLSRVQAQLRRKQYQTQASNHHILTFADVKLDDQKHITYRGGKKLELTTTEFSLLRCFLQHPEEVLSRDFLYTQVWDPFADAKSNVVDAYIGYLRKKLEAGHQLCLIETIRGAGYMLRATDAEQCERS